MQCVFACACVHSVKCNDDSSMWVFNFRELFCFDLILIKMVNVASGYDAANNNYKRPVRVNFNALGGEVLSDCQMAISNL